MLQLKVHHIGYLVKKKDSARAAFEGLGYTVSADWVHDTLRGIDICFMEKDGYTVELISPYTKDSTVSGLMTRFKNSPYHICYECSSIEKDGEALRAAGYVPTCEPAPAPALEDHRVCFYMHPSLGMIELLEINSAFSN